ncbi:monofunctional biosynthetic peptidoglycan transglycosylase [Phyllobacterium salinisoli]|uniref:monofunctional biosynthetic peptidoglycan transglycosylase n=1 Tax=Phyllobacterium salinisoli TaxID=1899321 RepID=UPI00190F9AA1|nr:monofunctional biosynthetic peptidoglycan transglycosylase [Phyllobacterium salinisoli]
MAKIVVRNRNGRGYLADPLHSWLARKILRIVIILAVAPILLLFVYLIPFVHPVSTLMLKDVVTFNGYDRRWMPIEEISPALVNSVLVSEDGQFCSHSGIDWRQLTEVITDAVDGEKTRGASTITMQTVKNLFLWNGRSFIRKGLELPLAVVADLILPKWRIMEIYLNIAEWGPGVYGAEAAAQYHFGRSASQLSSRQAAYLAAALPNPILRNPAKPGRGMQRLARVVEARARRSGAYVGCLQ